MRIKQILQSAFLGSVLSAAGIAYGQTDSNNALLSILVRKGILTQDEANQVQKEAVAEAAKAAAPAPAPAVAPSAAPAPAGSGSVASTANGFNAKPAGKSPLYFKIGIAEFSPLGFMDFTTVYRSALNGGDIGSSFGSIPYSNVAADHISETRFSAKNSRIGLRIDSKIGDTKVLGYLETDFLGQTANNINVASNSDVLRMRVYFVDVRNGPWEFLAGQDWSMMTPNRKGLSPIPGDIFYTQNVDVNYQVGLIWGRTPQVRAVYHATDELTFGVSLENPDQYVGSAVTLPTTAGFTATQLDTGAALPATDLPTANELPDTIVKAAYDTKIGDLPVHLDAAGLVRYFKLNTFTPTIDADSSTTAVSGSFNALVNVMPNLVLIGNVFGGKGGGRYLSTGLGPDLIVKPADANGVYSTSAVSAYAYLGGAEWDVVPTTKVYAYYGSANYGSKFAQLPSGAYVGYGFPGSANTNNKQIEEYTLGLTQILWKDATYGDLKLLMQASYLDRKPWFVAAGAPAKAHLGMGYIDVRYDLP